MFPGCRREPKRADRVVPQDDQENYGNVKKIAMQVLQDEGKAGLAAVTMRARFANGTCGWIEKECPVVGFAIVVTGCPKAERGPEDEDRRRQRPPAWLNQRRIER